MIYTSGKHYDVPQQDLLTFLFEPENPQCQAKEDTVIHCDAAAPDNGFTKSRARELTKEIGYELRNTFGIGAKGPGKDVVVCMSSGQPLLPALFYGVICAGGMYSVASSSFTAPELSRQIKQGSSNLIVCSEDAREVACQAARDCGVSLKRVLVISSSPAWSIKAVEGGQTVLPGKGSLEWERITDSETLGNSLICLLYSSGTTGLPKGVVLSHTNIVSECYIPTSMWWEDLKKREDRGEPPLEYRTLAHLPPAHIAGVQGYFINPFFMGGITFCMPKFDFVKFLEYYKRHRITLLFTVPPIFLLSK